jgi:hypothetical protein
MGNVHIIFINNLMISKKNRIFSRIFFVSLLSIKENEYEKRVTKKR